MRNYLSLITKTNNVFLFLGLNVFFVLHVNNLFFELLQLKVVVNTLVGLCILSVISWGVSKVLLRNSTKASLFTAGSFFVLLFYNFVQSAAGFLNRLGLLISDRLLLGLLILFLFFLIFFYKVPGNRVLLYLKTTLLVLICFEIVLSVYNKTIIKSTPDPLVTIHNQNLTHKQLPSVYLLVLDEYAGAETLKEKFNYSNNNFYHHLNNLGFKLLTNTHANYQYTALSMASTLNSGYLRINEADPVYTPENFRHAMNAVYYNRVGETFKKLGYSIHNYSPFSMQELPARYSNRFLHTDYWLVLYSTFFDRVIEMAPYFIARRTGKTKILEKLFERQVNLNNEILNDVLISSTKNVTKQSFSYIHLMMPHAPYAADSSGKINISFLTLKSADKFQRMNAYLQYLIYANKIVADFLSKLKVNTKGEAVVILLSDHGLRDQSVVPDMKLKFNSLSAVYLPDRFSNNWYNGISNVNQFRLLFSSITQQNVPLLKDSIVY